MAGRGDRNRDSGIGNQTLGNPEEEQDPKALSDLDEEEDKVELEGLTDPPGPGLDELGLDPALRLQPLRLLRLCRLWLLPDVRQWHQRPRSLWPRSLWPRRLGPRRCRLSNQSALHSRRGNSAADAKAFGTRASVKTPCMAWPDPCGRGVTCGTSSLLRGTGRGEPWAVRPGMAG
jgi:hypothetical protein